MPPDFASQQEHQTPLTILTGRDLDRWKQDASEAAACWVEANGFESKPGQILLIPDGNGHIQEVLAGAGADEGQDDRFHLASILERLPAGNYRLTNDLPAEERDEAALASLLAQYVPDDRDRQDASLVRMAVPPGIDGDRLRLIAESEFMTRDLINAPASAMTPDRLEQTVRDLAGEFGAGFRVIKGPELTRTCPLTHAVGRASEHPPRLAELRWGSTGPSLTLVGKGVCFDTGGLNIKPGRGMSLMKKDMAGAAIAIGLGRMIIGLDLPVRLRILVPIAENAVSGRAFRPGDVLTSSSGVRVEITNTDAEGRLLLADALELAREDEDDLLVTFATLTGAARVALGPEIVPFYTANDRLADTLATTAERVRDPVWRMPLWNPYQAMLKSKVADLVNSPTSGFAGSISAALFLLRFVQSPERFLHFDLYGWQNAPAPGRPVGGVGQAGRALLATIEDFLC